MAVVNFFVKRSEIPFIVISQVAAWTRHVTEKFSWDK
jgi:hypothetical protein